MLIASFASAQFEQYEEKGKVGFKFASEVVKKPKYDSLIIGDSEIVTAYKKDKVYYINSSGKAIHKGKFYRTSPFIKGTGILKNRRGKYAIIMTNGEFLMEYLSTEKPVKYGQMVFVESPYRNRLFNNNKLLEKKLDRVKSIGTWLISTTITKEQYTHTTNRRLLPDKKETAYRYHQFHKLYNAEEGTLEMDEISGFQLYAGNLLVEKNESPSALFALDGSREIENLREFKKIDSTYFTAMQGEERTLFSTHDLKAIISGNYELLLPKMNTIYALGDTTSEFPALDIYDYEGNLIKSELQYVSDLDEGRFLFAENGMQFIGTEFGEQLSGFYHGFGTAQNGYRIVFGAYTYGYMNDQTYAKVPGDYPVIGRKKSTYSSGRRRKGIIRTLVQGIVNTTRRVFGKGPVNYYPASNYDPNEINIVESGSGFEEGYAIVCLYQYQADNQYDSLTLTDNFFKLKYNFIDTTGQRLDKKEYDECRPFNKGYAWIKEGDYFYLINENGKRQKKYRFSGVLKDDNGYYIVRYRGKYGIINPDYELVVPCEHSIISFEDGKYIETYFSEKTVVYELPISN